MTASPFAIRQLAQHRRQPFGDELDFQFNAAVVLPRLLLGAGNDVGVLDIEVDFLEPQRPRERPRRIRGRVCASEKQISSKCGETKMALCTRFPCAGCITERPRFLPVPSSWHSGSPSPLSGSHAPAIALRDWAMSALRLDSLVSYVHPDNKASAAVAERLGAVLDPDAPRPNPGDLVYRHL